MITLVVGIFGPTANGDRFALFQILDATLASAVMMAVLVALTYTRLPWRPLQSANGEANGTATTDAAPATAETRRPTSAPDAYADST